MDRDSDQADLIEYASTGSHQALARLASRHVDFVYGMARREARDSHLAEDVTQAVFLILARRAARINPALISGWLFSTTRHVAANARRAAVRRAHHEHRAAAQIPEHVMSSDPAELEHLQHHLQAALAAVGESDRSIVLMRHMQALDVSQIAQAMHLSDAAVRKRLERTMQKLRRFLKGRGVMLETALICTAVAGISKPAPATLIAAVAGGATAPSASALGAATLSTIAWMPIKIAATILLLFGLTAGTVIGGWRIFARHTLVAQIQVPNPTSSPASAPSVPAAKSVTYSGTVVDPLGKPVPNVRVWSELRTRNPERSNSLEAQANTDAQGNFVLPALPPTVFVLQSETEWSERTLRFDCPQYAMAWSGRYAPRDAPLGEQIDVSIQLEDGAALEVQVRDSDGKPVANAEVSLRLQHMGTEKPGSSYGYLTFPTAAAVMKTDQRGSVTFDRIPRTARAHVLVSHPDYVRFDSQEDYTSDTYPARPGFGPFIATLERGGRMLVHLPASNGPSPIRAADFIATELRSRRYTSTQGKFDARGAYLFTGLRPGTYSVAIRPFSGGSPDVAIAPSKDVAVTLTQAVDAQLRSVPTYAVSGRIINQLTKRPMANQRMSLASDLLSWFANVDCDAAGRFTVLVPSGSIVLTYTSYPNGLRQPMRKNVKVDSGPIEIGDIEIQSQPAVRGRLVDASGKPISGSVIMSDEKIRAGAEGSFVLPMDEGDEKREVVFAFNDALTLGAALIVDEKYLDPKLEIPGAELPAIVLKPTSTITGEVADLAGKAVNDARIGLFFDLPDGMSTGNYHGPEWGGFSREANRFAFTSVPTGLEMYVDIEIEKAKAQPHASGLLPGEVRDLGLLPLKPIVPRTLHGTDVPGFEGRDRDFTGTASGRVLGPDDKPIVGARVIGWPENDLTSQRDDHTDHEGRFILQHLAIGENLTLDVGESQGNNKARATAKVGDQNIVIHIQPIASKLIGKPAPELALLRWLVGQPKNMEELRGRVVLLHLDVDVSEDGYGYEYEVLLDEMKRNESRGLTIIAIHCDPENARPNPMTLDDVAEYVKKKQIPFSFAIDDRQRTHTGGWTGGETAARYGLDEPAFILIDKKGIVRVAPTQPNLDEWIEKLLAE